jgi:hypothetical protein
MPRPAVMGMIHSVLFKDFCNGVIRIKRAPLPVFSEKRQAAAGVSGIEQKS